MDISSARGQKRTLHLIRGLVFGILISFHLSVFSQSSTVPESQLGTYKIDPAHSRVSFIVPHFVVSEVEGRFNDIKGEFTIAQPFTASKLTARVPAKSIDTGVKKRDDHLRSKDFFEVAKYPEMKLVGKSITGTPQSFKMVAALTIKDVTKDVPFEMKYTGFVKDNMGQHRAAFQATATINRKDFHINYNDKIDIGPAVGEEVKIRLWTEGIKLEDTKKGPPTQQ